MICPSCQKEIADNSRFCYLCGAKLIEQPPAQAAYAPGTGPRRLYRSATDRKLGGVCAGIAEYFEVDPTIIRILFVLALFPGGLGLVAYLVAWILIPLGPEGAPGSAPAWAGRRLQRSARDKKIGGVCAGVADYLGIDPTIVRVVWLCFALAGVGLFAYLVLWFILPLEDVQAASYPAAAGNP